MAGLPASFFGKVFFILQNYWGSLLAGAGRTIAIAIVGTFFGVVIGLLVGTVMTVPKQMNENPVKTGFMWAVKKLLFCYIEFFRGTPMIVQSVFIYYGARMLFNIHMDPLFAGFFIVSINTGAYMAETVRGGILSIDPGQVEAAKAIGMTHAQTMTSVIFPQAFRNIIPQIGNNFIINVKDTSVMFIIGFTEFFASHRYIVGINNKYFPSAVIEMAGYLAMTLIASGILRLIEKLMDGSDSYELVQEDPLTMTAGTYSHPKRGSNYDEQSKEFRERTEQELKFGRSRGDR